MALGGKRIRGRKRHPIVDTLGLLFASVVTGAKVEDAVAAPALVRQIRPEVCPRWELLWADSKSHNHALGAWMGRPNAGPVRIAVTRQTDDEPGFKPIQWRQAIARTSGWVKRSRRSALDYEKATASSAAMVRITRTKLMLNRVTDQKPEFPFRYPKVKKTARIFPNRFSARVWSGASARLRFCGPDSSGGSGHFRGTTPAHRYERPNRPIRPDPIVPRCAATRVARNGVNECGSPTYRPRACGRRFVAEPEAQPVSDPLTDPIRRMLASRMGARAIARVTL